MTRRYWGDKERGEGVSKKRMQEEREEVKEKERGVCEYGYHLPVLEYLVKD